MAEPMMSQQMVADVIEAWRREIRETFPRPLGGNLVDWMEGSECDARRANLLQAMLLVDAEPRVCGACWSLVASPELHAEWHLIMAGVTEGRGWVAKRDVS